MAGGFREEHNLLGADFLLPLDRVCSPAAQVHREGLACLLAARTGMPQCGGSRPHTRGHPLRAILLSPSEGLLGLRVLFPRR